MNIFAISDLHLSFSSEKPMDIFGDHWVDHWKHICEDWQKKVSDDDIVLIAGDLSWGKSLEEAAADFNEIGKQKGYKIFIRGNHDYWSQSSKKLKAILPDKMYFIKNNAIRFGNYIFCGSRGWCIPERGGQLPEEDDKILKREVIRMELSLEEAIKLKKDDDAIIISLIHFPPFNSSFESSAFTELFEKYNVNSVIYGHLHGQTSRTKLDYCKNNVKYYLTSCDLTNNKLIKISAK